MTIAAVYTVHIEASKEAIIKYPWIDGFAFSQPSYTPLPGIGGKARFQKNGQEAILCIVDRQFEIPPTDSVAILHVVLA